MRVYVPYGTQWYGYLMRRLAERPANLTFFARALISKSWSEFPGRPTVAILGVGVMGETLLSGLIRGGRPVDELLVGEKRAERAEPAARRSTASGASPTSTPSPRPTPWRWW